MKFHFKVMVFFAIVAISIWCRATTSLNFAKFFSFNYNLTCIFMLENAYFESLNATIPENMLRLCFIRLDTLRLALNILYAEALSNAGRINSIDVKFRKLYKC